MSGKQMEGDNVERRRRARRAKEEGKAPAEAKVTLGAGRRTGTDIARVPDRSLVAVGRKRRPRAASNPGLPRNGDASREAQLPGSVGGLAPSPSPLQRRSRLAHRHRNTSGNGVSPR